MRKSSLGLNLLRSALLTVAKMPDSGGSTYFGIHNSQFKGFRPCIPVAKGHGLDVNVKSRARKQRKGVLQLSPPP